MPRLILGLLLIAVNAQLWTAQVPHLQPSKPDWDNFQWSFTFAVGLHKNKQQERVSTAYLWIPPKTKQVKGVLVGQQVLMEQALARDPLIRATCAANDLAIVYIAPAFDVIFKYGQDDPELKRKAPDRYLESALDALSKISGYEEIAAVPLIPYGHSVGTIFAHRVGYWKPERTAAILLLKGGLGQAPEWDPEATLDGVPVLHIQGQFEEFGSKGPLQEGEDRTAGFRACAEQYRNLRQENPEQTLMGLLIEPGGTHFAWSPTMATVVAPFLEAIAKNRLGGEDPTIPRPMSVGQGAYLKADFVNIYENSSALPPPVLAKDFQGNPRDMYWYPSLQTAQAVAAIVPNLGKKSQYVGGSLPKYAKQPKVKKHQAVPPATTYPELLGWQSPRKHGHDNRIYFSPSYRYDWTFELKGQFLDSIPKRYPGEGGMATHSSDGDVKLRVFGGNVRQLDDTTFTISGDWRFGDRVAILAYHEGDDEYRYAAQHLLVKTKKFIKRTLLGSRIK